MAQRNPKPRDVEYDAFINMHHRCFNPKHKQYKDYGERGIWVCAEWVDNFDQFLTDVGRKPDPSLTLDRIDNSKGYEPGNVRWASRQTQSRNIRSNRWITAFGETKLLCEWAEEYGITSQLIRNRATMGWPIEDAIARPIQKSSRWKHYNIDGYNMTCHGHANRLGLSSPGLSYRMAKHGMSMEEAIADAQRAKK